MPSDSCASAYSKVHSASDDFHLVQVGVYSFRQSIHVS